MQVEGKKEKKHLLGIEPMPDLKSKMGGIRGEKKKKKKSSPQNRTQVPLMNGHNDQSCANLG